MIIPGHKIDPWWVAPHEEENVQPASYDVRLDDHFLSPMEVDEPIDVVEGFDDYDSEHHVDYYDLEPGECVLASTWERIDLPNDVVGRVEGRSSVGRLFVVVHSTAGFLDPGFTGQVTLEISNLSKNTVRLRVGMRIAQIAFYQCTGECEPYDGKYQHQAGATASRIQEDFSESHQKAQRDVR